MGTGQVLRIKSETVIRHETREARLTGRPDNGKRSRAGFRSMPPALEIKTYRHGATM